MTRHMLFKLAVALSFSCLAYAGDKLQQNSAVKSTDAEQWSIEESKSADKVNLDFVAKEGTRISVDVSPDGEFIAFDLLGHIYQMSIKGGEAKALTSGRSWNINPRYSADGKTLAFTSDRSGSEDIWLLDRDSGEFENLTDMPEAVFSPRWSADGSAIYASSLDLGVKLSGWRFKLRGGKKQLIEPKEIFQPLARFTEYPDKQLVLFEQLDDKLYQGGCPYQKPCTP